MAPHSIPTPATVAPGIYRHFKGSTYEVFAVARHSETEEELVFYRKLYDDYSHWARPLAMFLEHVERDGYRGPRFVRIA
ncbi:MAG: DUF1653 domain-containing protein [Actinobacteria bacterium]|nr:DUF1653 domain-containing protein [Actinomycetota bacterium]